MFIYFPAPAEQHAQLQGAAALATLPALMPPWCQDTGQGTPKYTWFRHPSTAACSRGLPAPPAALQANPSLAQCREQDSDWRHSAGCLGPPSLSCTVQQFGFVRQHFQPSTFHPGHLLCFHPMLLNSSSTALHETFKLLCVHLPVPNTGRPHHQSRQDMQQGESATQQRLFKKNKDKKNMQFSPNWVAFAARPSLARLAPPWPCRGGACPCQALLSAVMARR